MAAINETLMRQAASMLKHSKCLLVGTGAGMSADSGIETYRVAGQNAWQNYGRTASLGLNPEDLSCPAAFEEQPELAWGFFETRRRAMHSAVPHEGYKSLHNIARGVPVSFIQTTNVDGFHLRAGWPDELLHEVHGSMWRLQCCGQFWIESRVPLVSVDDSTLRASELPRCTQCNRVPRPHVLLFADLEYIGNPVAEAARRSFHDRKPDVMLIVGESGVIPTHVHDAQTLKRRFGTQIIDINPDIGSKSSRLADIAIQSTAREALLQLETMMLCRS